MSEGTIAISAYIVARIEQLGVRSVFGVPGDFNLTFLDYIEDNKNIEWIGCCNELNASYAADGYARVTGQLGVLVTTFGVGELSAINGVAGAYSERVPVLHIVGVPSTAQQAHHSILHHTMGDGRMNIYVDAAANVTVAQGLLMDPATAAETIDRVIIAALTSCRPTYLTIPLDMVHVQIPNGPLSRPLTNEVIRAPLYVEPTGVVAPAQVEALDEIVKLWTAAKNPAILVDVGAVRFNVIPLVQDLLATTGATYFTTAMAKGPIDGTKPQFGGIYVGSQSLPGAFVNWEKVDMVIAVGLLASDFNSGGFTFHLPAKATVELHSEFTKVAGTTYPGVTFFTMLPALNKALANAIRTPVEPLVKDGLHATAPADWRQGSTILQSWFWAAVGEYFKPGDVIVSETGTANFGLIDVEFPPNSVDVNQILYGSIGYSVGATLGASVGAREVGRRTLAFIGDGSAQLTATDFSTMVRNGVTPVVFILNNDGYTVERLIHGPKRRYNDIQPWDWQGLLKVFGAEESKVTITRAATPAELAAVLEGLDETKLTFVEVMLEQLDAPRLFNQLLSSYNAN